MTCALDFDNNNKLLTDFVISFMQPRGKFNVPNKRAYIRPFHCISEVPEAEHTRPWEPTLWTDAICLCKRRGNQRPPAELEV